MNVSKRLLCIILSFSIILSLIGCGQTIPTATQTEPVPSEKTQVAVDSYLSIAQGFVDKEDFDSAIAVLEQAKDITDDERIAAMLAQIDSLQGIPLNVKLFTNAEHLKTGRAEIHNVTACERSNGVVRYTIEYTASAGMHIQLSGGRLGHRFDFETSGFKDKLVFEISSQDVQDLKGAVAVTFGFNDEDYYYLQINTPWQDDSAYEAFPLTEDPLAQFDLTFWHQNELQNAGGNIDRISVADSGENWLFTVVHALPENMDATVTLWSEIPRSDASRKVFLEQPSVTTGSEAEFRFEISKETLSQQKAMNISFGSEDAGNYGADFELPFRIQKTTESPIGQSVQPGYYVENKLKSGSYEIHDITLQRLNNGYARYTLDMTLSDNMRYAAHLITDLHNPGGNQFISDGYSNGERKQYVLDISEEQLAKSCFLSLYIIADENDQNSFSIRIPHSCLSAYTGGRPMGKPVPLNYSAFKNPDEQQIRVCEAQFLNNGYVRYTLAGTFPGNALCRFMDQSDGTIVSGFFATEADAGEYTFTMDVPEQTARESKAFTVFVNMFSDRKMATIAVDNFPITDPALVVVIPKIEVKLIYHKLNIT